MKATSKCLVCLKKAVVFGGHVQKGKTSIIAGWCREHIDHLCPNLLRRKGCYGAYHKKYGLINKL